MNSGFGARRIGQAATTLLTLASTGVAFGQAADTAMRWTAQDADQAFAQLREEVPGLRANWDFTRGFPSFVFGRAIRLDVAPQTDAQHDAVARRFIDLHPGLFGVDSSGLVTEQVKRLEMRSVGTSDKTVVEFSQWVAGVPVVGGSINFLFNEDGSIVGIENHALPNAGGLDVDPVVGEPMAQQIAKNAYGHQPARVVNVEFGVVPNAAGDGGVAAWIVEVGGAWDALRELPIQEKVEVDAHSGAVIRKSSTIHSFTDLLGHLNLKRTQGNKPDTTSNPPVNVHAQWVRGTSAVGSADTDLVGNWKITYSGSAVQAVTFTFGSSSVYAWVDDLGNADMTKTWNVTPGVKFYSGLNGNPSEYNTAECNAQAHAVNFVEWIRALDPADSKMWFRQRLYVNENSSCNAYYNGSSTHYYRKAGGCNNTAYSSVVWHETGHWANDKYGSNNGGDGFGEGAADGWSMYGLDDPIVGDDFFVGGGDIRDGRNTRQYCGSCGAGCYGEVHVDGEVLMGAFWKVRDHLNTTHGDATGDAIADSLWLRWFQAYNAKTICDTNETQILTLDDDNGNIDDGTPHSSDIEAGFEDQGYPGYY